MPNSFVKTRKVAVCRTVSGNRCPVPGKMLTTRGLILCVHSYLNILVRSKVSSICLRVCFNCGKEVRDLDAFIFGNLQGRGSFFRLGLVEIYANFREWGIGAKS